MKNDILSFAPHRHMHACGKKYLYINRSGGLYEIDDDTFSILCHAGQSRNVAYAALAGSISRENFDGILDGMKKAGFLAARPDEDGSAAPAEEYPPVTSVTLNLVQRCNMRCSYCFAGQGTYGKEGTMSLETARTAVEYFLDQCDGDELNVLFFGGEPLVGIVRIKEVVAFAREAEKRRGKKISFGMTTNGTLLTPAVCRYLDDCDISYMVSVDGGEEEHDRCRVTLDGRGTHRIIMENTAGKREKGRLGCRVTVAPPNLNCISRFRHLVKAGFRSVFIDGANNLMSDDEYLEYTSCYMDFLEYLKNLILAGDYDAARKSANLVNSLADVSGSGRRYRSCGAARGMAAVDIDGDIYPCQRFIGEAAYRIGTVFSGMDARRRMEYLRSVSIESMPECMNCWAQNLCLGHCANTSHAVFGAVGRTSGRICNFSRMTWDKYLEIYLHLSDATRERILYRE